MPNVNKPLDIVKVEISKLASIQIFLLRDLYKGYEWNRISRSNHWLLGTLFVNYVRTMDIGVVSIEKITLSQ